MFSVRESLSLGRPCLVQSAHRKQVHFLAPYVEPPACLQLGSEVAVYRTLNQRSSCEDVLWTPHSHVSVLSVTRAQQVSCDLGESSGIGRWQVGTWVVGTAQNTKKIPPKTGSRSLEVLSAGGSPYLLGAACCEILRKQAQSSRTLPEAPKP